MIEGMQKVTPGASVKAVPFEIGGGTSSGERKNVIPPPAKAN
jgi:hypothetical protein